MDKLMDILRSLRPDINFETADQLMDGEVLDSFDMIALVGEMETAFGVTVGLEELVPKNFNSAAAMAGLLKGLGAKI
jgi:acyl carrier protein